MRNSTGYRRVKIGETTMLLSAATISVISRCASASGTVLGPKELMRLQNLHVPHVVSDDGAVRIEEFSVID